MGRSNVLSWRLNHGISSYNNKNIKLEFLTIQVLENIAIENKEKILLRDIY